MNRQLEKPKPRIIRSLAAIATVTGTLLVAPACGSPEPSTSEDIAVTTSSPSEHGGHISEAAGVHEVKLDENPVKNFELTTNAINRELGERIVGLADQGVGSSSETYNPEEGTIAYRVTVEPHKEVPGHDLIAVVDDSGTFIRIQALEFGRNEDGDKLTYRQTLSEPGYVDGGNSESIIDKSEVNSGNTGYYEKTVFHEITNSFVKAVENP